MSFEVGEKLEVKAYNKTYIGTLNRICLGINEKECPTHASIILKDDVLLEQTYGHVHIFCCDISEIKRYSGNEV